MGNSVQSDKKDAETDVVTPEMAQVGAEIVGDYDGKFVTAREIAIRAYLAMEAVRRAANGE